MELVPWLSNALTLPELARTVFLASVFDLAKGAGHDKDILRRTGARNTLLIKSSEYSVAHTYII